MTHAAAGIVLAIFVAAPATGLAATDPATGIPVYPGAAKLAYQSTAPIDICGHKMVTTVYRVTNTPLATVVAWYRRALPGVTPLDRTLADPADHNTQRVSTFLVSGGANTVTLGQTTYGGPLASAMSKQSHQVVVGFNRYSPPVNTDMLSGRGCADK